MAYQAKTLFLASGYEVDKGDYIPTEVIGQAASSLVGAGYVVEIPDDEEKDNQFFEERGYLLTPKDQEPNETVPGIPNDPPIDRQEGTVPLPYEQSSTTEGEEVIAELDERTEGERTVDPNTVASPEKVEEMEAAAEAGGDFIPPYGAVGEARSDVLSGSGRPTFGAEPGAETSEESSSSGTSEPEATDGAKELAEQENVDLSKVEGTGNEGKVTKDDVKRHLDEQ